VRPYVVLHNLDANIRGGAERDAIAARDSAEASESVRVALSALGPTEVVATVDGDPTTLVPRLAALNPRVVFNLCEAARGVPELEAAVAGLLDLMGVAYTGNTPGTLALCLDKSRTKALLHGAGVPVPAGCVLRDAEKDPIKGVEYPVIVKPACMDASHGIEPANVVTTEKAARAKATELLDRFGGTVIVEDFVDGREINVTVADMGEGPVVFPLAEIDWKLPPHVPRVVGYDAKWVEGTEGYEGTPVICPATLAPRTEQRVREVALAAFLAVSGRDYARVDVRLDQDERPFVLEVNPNPCLAETAGLARAAKAAGWSYDDFVRRIATNAEARGPLAPLPREG